MQPLVLDNGRLIVGGPRVRFTPPAASKVFYTNMLLFLLTEQELDVMFNDTVAPSAGEPDKPA